MRGFKKIFFGLVFILLLSTRAYAYDFDTPLVIDGMDCETAYKSDSNYYGFISNSRTYVPLRFISETLGFDVIYDQTTRNIRITGNGQEVGMNVRSKNLEVNGVKKTMDVAPILYKDSTYVPIRYVGESLNKPVSWNPNDRAVYIGNGFNSRNIDYSNFKKLDFSKFGFNLYVKDNFQDNILIENSSGDGLVNFYDKSLYKKGTMNGLVGSIGTEDEKAFFSAINIYQEDGKVLVRYEFSDGSLKKLDPSLRGSDNILKVFQESVAIPTNNTFPNFDLKGLNKLKASEAKAKTKAEDDAKVLEKAKVNPNKEAYTTFTFGNPKVTIKIPNDLMQELVVKKLTWRPGYALCDKKIVQSGNEVFGGCIKFYEQFEQKKGEYEMYDGLYKLINSKGTIKTAEGIPRDAQIDFNNKEMTKRFLDLEKRVDKEVIVTVEK
ncbi:MAG: copper amine oxidase N-terminal domain-containing protein [Peptoniphilus harei]|nr:copper amine oxidase N-terminal domain-containing protein [Peptoniphilus harei]